MGGTRQTGWGSVRLPPSALVQRPRLHHAGHQPPSPHRSTMLAWSSLRPGAGGGGGGRGPGAGAGGQGWKVPLLSLSTEFKALISLFPP